MNDELINKLSILFEKLNFSEKEKIKIKNAILKNNSNPIFNGFSQSDIFDVVKVPEHIKPVFKKAQEYVYNYYKNFKLNPKKGSIKIGDEDYILIKASSISIEFFDLISKLYQDRGLDESSRIARNLLFDFAHALGSSDAKNFHKKLNITNPIDKLSVGPVHFAYSGWAFVDIFPESNISPDENFFLIYDHIFSFEAEAWLKKNKTTNFPVCIMNAGYSSGWCEVSFGIPLVSVEINCRAKGDTHCRFIMAQPSRIEHYLKIYSKTSKSEKSLLTYEIPEFFQRKKLEDELKKSIDTSQALLNAPFESAILIDSNNSILALNITAAKRFKKKPSELIGMNLFDLIPNNISKNRKKKHDEIINTKKPKSFVDKRDGKWLENHLFPIIDEYGNVIRIAIYSRDITDKLKKEKELLKHRTQLEKLVFDRTNELEQVNKKLISEITKKEKFEKDLMEEKERLSVTLQSMGEGVIAMDKTGRITLINHIAEKLFELDHKNIIGRTIDNILLFQKSEEKKKKIKIFELIKGKIIQVSFNELIFTNNNKKLLVDINISPIRNYRNEVIGYIFIFYDITEKKQIEKELFHKRKIESIGILAGGIAHDFNNFLTGIINNISLMKKITEKNNPLYNNILAIEKATLMAKSLTKQLLTYSRGGEPLKESIILSEYLKDFVQFFLTGSNIIAIYDIFDNIYPVDIDIGQFNQVINNIIMNSLQAMPEGGKIYIKIENIHFKKFSKNHKSKKAVKLSITDKGCGIDPESLLKVFDPYFTTKQGRMGLGLYTAYSIINKHNGLINVDSELGKGTSVYIYLPANEKIEINDKKNNSHNKQIENKCILFMDDEQIIRDITLTLLKHIGYEVDEAKNGEDAIEKYRIKYEKGEPYNIVILDLTVHGGMGGKKAMEYLKTIDPNIKAIVSSGYSDDPVLSNFSEYGFKGILPKPYTLKELENVLSNI